MLFDSLVRQIATMIRSAIDEGPAELQPQISDNGIVLVGGGSMLRRLDERVQQETQVPCRVADAPAGCAIRGAGRSLER